MCKHICSFIPPVLYKIQYIKKLKQKCTHQHTDTCIHANIWKPTSNLFISSLEAVKNCQHVLLMVPEEYWDLYRMKYITCIILISITHVLLIFVVNAFVCACVHRRAHTWRSSWSTRDSSAEFFSFSSVFKDSSIDARSVTLMWSCLRSKIISCRRLPSATVVTSGNCGGGKEMVPIKINQNM